MANDGRHNWGKGFPFSPSPFKGQALSGPMPFPIVNLSDACINDAKIQEGRTEGAPPAPFPSKQKPEFQPPSPDYLTTSRPFAQRPIARKAGLRLLPLESFIWGDRNIQFLPRARSDYALIWVTKGAAQLGFPRQNEPLATGTVCFIPAGMAFTFSPHPTLSGYALLIAPSLVQTADPSFPISYIAGNIRDGANTLLTTLRELKTEGANRNQGAGMSCLLGMLALQLARLTPISPIKPFPRPIIAKRVLAERFIALAQKHMQDGYTIADIAEELGASTATLNHACLSAKGKRAIEMLRAGDQSPDFIAESLGYSSYVHFTRAFVEATGKRPEKFLNPIDRTRHSFNNRK